MITITRQSHPHLVRLFQIASPDPTLETFQIPDSWGYHVTPAERALSSLYSDTLVNFADEVAPEYSSPGLVSAHALMSALLREFREVLP